MHNYHTKIIPRCYHLAHDLCKTWKAIGHIASLADLKLKFRNCKVCKYLWQVTEIIEEEPLP